MKNSIFFALIAITFSALGANAQIDPQSGLDRLERVEERLDAHDTQLNQQDERIQENENFRLFGTAAFAGLTSSGGMFVGHFASLPVSLLTWTHKTTVNDFIMTNYMVAGGLASASTFGMLLMLDAGWQTAAIAAGTTAAVAGLGMVGTMALVGNENYGSALLAYPATIVAAGVATSVAVVVSSKLELTE